ncbi:MAG: putative baseplate assembly protein [Alphaproteobacteria bacterium]|nr:MAG: putative baseplate assembly protein [Alphaproteobacteria bacterium]
MSNLSALDNNHICCNEVDACCCDEMHDNVSGQSVITHRPGGYKSYVDAMRMSLSGSSALRRLTVRDNSDPTIALLDAWGCTLEVLSFYQDRIANEHYLNTATERLSVVNMAEQIGYKPQPGVSASTYLAFSCDEFAGSPESVVVVQGTMAQSVPGQDEIPQIFETDVEITARPEWNTLRVQTYHEYVPSNGNDVLYLDGGVSDLKSGDVILIVGNKRYDSYESNLWDQARITDIEMFEEAESVPAYTKVTLNKALSHDYSGENPRIFHFRRRANFFGFNAMPWAGLPVNLRVGEEVPASDGSKEFVTGLYADRENSWADNFFSKTTEDLYLDQLYSEIAPQGWILVVNPFYQRLFQIADVSEVTQTDYMLSAQVTKLTVLGDEMYNFSPKAGLVLCQSVELGFGVKPVDAVLNGQNIVLSEAHGLSNGQVIALSGEDETGDIHTDILVIDQATESNGGMVLRMETSLSHDYIPQTVTINANVTIASHGRSVQETLGSGDGSSASQSFVLMQMPLAHMNAATVRGYQTTLEIRVDDVLWHEVESFYERGADERIYVTSIADNGQVTVQFGDGINGARLSSGRDNVFALYRVGTGLAGVVEAGKITQLLTMPLGCSKVTNPIASEGGSDPETLDTARQNAPLSVVTMNRIVSLKDFEDFVRAYPGIGKAQAVTLWDGDGRVVHLTVSLEGAVSLEQGGITEENLRVSIDAARHVDHDFKLSGYDSLSFICKAELVVHADYLYEMVKEEAELALAERFSFDSRMFGQDVTLAEIYACLHDVGGIEGVDVNALYFSGEAEVLHNRLVVTEARNENGEFRMGELLTIHTGHLRLTEKEA